MTREEQFDYLQIIQTGHEGAIAGNPNEADALNVWQRLTESKTALAVLSQCTTKIMLKGASDDR